MGEARGHSAFHLICALRQEFCLSPCNFDKNQEEERSYTGCGEITLEKPQQYMNKNFCFYFQETGKAEKTAEMTTNESSKGFENPAGHCKEKGVLL